MKSVVKIGLIFCMVLASAVSQARSFDEDKHYTKLPTAITTQSGEKIEVLEFFWYGCPHCFSFEPVLKQWTKKLPKNVSFVRLPAPLNPRWMVHSKTYYALQQMNSDELDKYHSLIFNAMHIKRMRLTSKAQVADFLEEQGVNKAQFLDHYDSFTVQMRAQSALKLAQQYQVNGVPLLTVNGKYKISGKQAGSYENMVAIADYLISKESSR